RRDAEEDDRWLLLPRSLSRFRRWLSEHQLYLPHEPHLLRLDKEAPADTLPYRFPRQSRLAALVLQQAGGRGDRVDQSLVPNSLLSPCLCRRFQGPVRFLAASWHLSRGRCL